MPIVTCKTCDRRFSVKLFWIKNGGGKYCSLECKYSGTRKGRYEDCFTCGKKTYKQLKQLEHSKSGNYFCSKSCQTQWRNRVFIGPKHANWKHGRNSYRSVLDRHKIPRVCTLCAGDDERVLAVHHIDKDRLNNRVENLAWLCHNCHFLVHHDIVEQRRFFLKFAGR